MSINNLEAFKAIIYDFDGVIVDSNNIKDDVFRKIFQDYPEKFEELYEYHLQHNATPRTEKFRHVAYNILDIQNKEKWIESSCLKFQQETRKLILACPFIVGAIEFLKKYYKQKQQFIASATPQTELDFLIDRKDLRTYFKKTYGAPTKKVEIFKEILKSESLQKTEVLYIGDSPEDYEAAQIVELPFIGIHGRTDFSKHNCDSFLNFAELLKNTY